MVGLRDAPEAQARAMLGRYGTPEEARHVAVTCQRMHEPGSPSHTFWRDVLAALRKATTGKPHSRAQRRKLREQRK
jgi:alkylated DNA nucleotide flippase Atl1